ncbi:unnamed protein product [Spirodela intermedia]|uniref:Uncharacterized protein n=1 Tax=Spirodela intermedia TaxID=51605 RepID=A0A7I8KCI6_SPIIN|nr:unnamed protein product [Spirodela intermedia]
MLAAFHRERERERERGFKNWLRRIGKERECEMV